CGVAAHDRQVREVEHQDAAGVVGGDVVVDVGVGRVLDLDAGDVVFGAAVADDDVVRLADIDAGVGGAVHGDALDQDVLRLDRIDAIGAVLGLGPAGPFDGEIPVGDVVGALGLDPVAL